MGRVAGKIALVTGGASGLGRAASIRLAEEGASVFVTDINDEGGRETVAAIEAAGGTAFYMNHDVTDEAQWDAVIAEVESRYGPLDILVNNAGIAISKYITDLTTEEWRRVLAINLDSIFFGTKRGVLSMKKAGGGSIINIASVAGLIGVPGLSAYCATKGGLRLFSKAVAAECGYTRSNIRVNSVHPGSIDTPIWGPTEEIRKHTLGMASPTIPMGRVGEPLDIANAILYLASDEAKYVTGIELTVDGGQTAV